MKAQLERYNRISEQGCGDVWWVVHVKDPSPEENQCFATCTLQRQDTNETKSHACQWTGADWGNTLRCEPRIDEGDGE